MQRNIHMGGSVAGGMLALGAASLALAGPDLFTCHFGGTSPNTGFVNHGEAGGVRAFSVLTIACNQGDQVLRWNGDTADHPVMTQNIYRLRSGRFEHIGMSWAKHGISAAGQTWCTTCQPGGNSQLLGVGCCDAYGEVLNGNQSRLGPRSEINAANGTFPHPFCSPAAGGLNCPSASTIVHRRTQVKQTDLDPSPGVVYFFEVHHITADDIVFSNPRTDHNNASHRSFSITAQGDIAAWTSGMVTYEPAIRAWKQADPAVVESFVDVPNDGRFWVAAKATQSGDQWNYEYAVFNLNSDRSARTFQVPLSGCAVQVENIGFHDVDYHSGDPYDGTDWAAAHDGAQLTWATPTHAQNPNANALRWSTLYNFRFTTNRAPVNGQVTMGLFKPGTPSSVAVNTLVPSQAIACAGDIAPDGGDCQVGVPDLLRVISAWGPCPPQPATCVADLNGDETVGVPDLLFVISRWGACE